MDHTTNKTKIDLYQRFSEGSELGEAVDELLRAANTMNGLGMHHETQLALVIVEKIISDYCYLGRDRGLLWYQYAEIDSELYHTFTNEHKMSKEEYEADINDD